MADIPIAQNAVLGDPELQERLMAMNPEFGEFCIRVSGELWGKPLLDQKTKALITLAVDVVIQAEGAPFANHVDMAVKQGVTREEMEELFMFMMIYAGFNKAGIYFPALDKILGPKQS